MRQIMLLKDFEADIIACTPSYAIYIAEEMRAMGIKPSDLKLKTGISGAEPWSEEMRKNIETSLGIEAYDIYGLSEICGPGVSIDCKYHNGLHINEDYFYPEILCTKTLEPLPYGSQGELVFTTLSKTGIPLIRYRTRDITTLHNEICACGRTGVRMAKVKGRSDDMLIIRGVNVFPSQIESVILGCKEIEPYYMIVVDRVNNLDVMEIQVELSEKSFSDEVRKLEILRRRLEGDLQSMLSVSASIKLVSPGTLPRSEGKAKRIIDKRII